MLTTTSCLLNREPQCAVCRRPTSSGISRPTTASGTWSGSATGIAGDDTDGHVDDLARFVDARTIVTAVEADPADDNHRVLRDNRRRLDRARDADGRPFTIVELPMPHPVVHEGMRLPATYVNF